MPSSIRTTLLTLLTTLVGTPLLVEAAYRFSPLPITVQIVDLARLETHEVDGQVLWTEHDQALQESDFERCHQSHPQRPVVVLLGSSILASSSLTPPETVRDAMQAATGEVCVRSLARPGYNFDQQAASLDEARGAHPVDLLVVELWSNSPKRYTRMGRRLATLDGLKLRDGLPIGGDWLPEPLHRLLLTWSHAYQHVTLVSTPRDPRPESVRWTELNERAEVAAQGWPDAPVLVYGAPGLQQLDAWQAGGRRRVFYTSVAERLGADRVIHGADLFETDELPSIRLDTCCHYNAAGARRVGEVLGEAAAEMLRPERASEPAPSPPHPSRTR